MEKQIITGGSDQPWEKQMIGGTGAVVGGTDQIEDSII